MPDSTPQDCATPPAEAAELHARDGADEDGAPGLEGTGGTLQKLEDKLDGALSALQQRNHQLEDYLDFLAEERRRELQGKAADQLTLDDIPHAQPDGGETDAPAKPAASADAPA